MKRTLTIGAATAALLLAGAGVALAQNDDGPKNCGDAVVALTNAQNAHTAAQAADKALADAVAADKAEAAARAALVAAQEAALSAGVPIASQTPADVTRLEGELAGLEKVAVSERTQAEQARIDDIRTKLPLIRATVAAQKNLDAAAETAGKTDADKLRTEAEKTDADKTGKAVDQARADFDRLCQPGDPAAPAPTTGAPAPVKSGAPGYSQVQAVPVGGVATGA